MNKIVLVLVATLLLTGCGYFTAQPRLEECESLLEESKVQIEEGNEYLLEALEEINKLEDYVLFLEDSLGKCQTLKNELESISLPVRRLPPK